MGTSLRPGLGSRAVYIPMFRRGNTLLPNILKAHLFDLSPNQYILHLSYHVPIALLCLHNAHIVTQPTQYQ